MKESCLIGCLEGLKLVFVEGKFIKGKFRRRRNFNIVDYRGCSRTQDLELWHGLEFGQAYKRQQSEIQMMVINYIYNL